MTNITVSVELAHLVTSVAPRMETLRRIQKLRDLQNALYDTHDIDLTLCGTVEPWWVLVEQETATDVALILGGFMEAHGLDSETLLPFLQSRLGWTIGLDEDNLLWFGHLMNRHSFRGMDHLQALTQEAEKLEQIFADASKPIEEVEARAAEVEAKVEGFVKRKRGRPRKNATQVVQITSAR